MVTLESRPSCSLPCVQAAAAQLQASAALWSDAGSQGCWRDLQALPAAQQHLQACGQLYCAAGVVR